MVIRRMQESEEETEIPIHTKGRSILRNTVYNSNQLGLLHTL